MELLTPTLSIEKQLLMNDFIAWVKVFICRLAITKRKMISF